MKPTLTKTIRVVVFSLFTLNTSVYSQWQLGGNNDFPGATGLISNSNFFGGTQTADVRLGTGGVSRIFIAGTSAPPPVGFVGIGAGFVNPNQLLTVNGGNINVQNTTNNNGYMIGNVMTLWRGSAGNPSNIFVGGGAGTNNSSGLFNTFCGTSSGFASSTGNNNTFVGFASGASNDGASDNTFIGFRSGVSNTGAGSIQNTFVGSQSGQANSTGTRNTFLGFESGFANISGTDNIYLGWGAGRNGSTVSNNNNIMIGSEAGFNNIAEENIFIGTRAGFTQNTSAIGNVYIGHNSGMAGTTGNQNVFVGWKTGIGNTIGSNNVMMGYNTGISQTTGAGNTFVGSIAAQNNTSGEVNTFIGVSAGNLNTIGNSHTYIGANATPASGNLFNTAGFGWNATATSDNKMILGDNAINVGIGLNNDLVYGGPQNKLEIDAGLNGMDPSIPGTTGASGLRFRDLRSDNLPDINLTTGVLSVDIDGDVILVQDQTGTTTADNGLTINPANNVQLGQDCGAVGNPGQLLSFREIPMNDNNIFFSGQSFAGLNSVSIGYPNCSTITNAKLSVLEAGINIGLDQVAIYGTVTPDPSSINSYGIRGTNNGGSNGYGGQFECVGASTSNIGVSGIAGGPTYNVGGQFSAGFGTSSNTGVLCTANNGPTAIGLDSRANFGTLENYGVRGNGAGGNNAYGGWFKAANGTTLNYGVYAEVNGSAPTDYAVYAIGDVLCSGSTASWSDSTMKTNFNEISNASALLMQLNPYSFNYRVADFPTMHLDNDLHFGLVAQNVETVIPELVGSFLTPQELDSAGNVIIPSQTLKTLEYTEIIPILIAGFNDQQTIIENQQTIITQQQTAITELQQQMNDVIAAINNCCSQGNSLTTPGNGNNNSNQDLYKVTNIDVKLGDNDCVLNVNSPNPFRDNTTISYLIPDNAKFAQIIFYNSLGQAIKIVDIDEKGQGRLNVYGEDLRSGMYSYSLIIDGNVCETHKMIKE